MVTYVDVRVQNLELDVENPRLPRADPGKPWTQPLILDYFAQHRNSKGLAATIAREGMLNPSKRLIVTGVAGQKKYVVLEGNRRLAMLKLLQQPQMAPTEALRSAYRKIAKSAAELPTTAACVLVATRQEAAPWISMEHASGDEGATVKWEAMEKERFADLMTGGKARHKKAMDLAELLQQSGHITTAEFKKIPITSLDRLLSDPYVRGRLDPSDAGGALSQKGALAATRIVKELAHGVVKVDDIKSKGDRKIYIDAIVKNPSKLVIVPARKAAPEVSSRVANTRTQRSAWQRATVIPADFKPRIADTKLREIYKELRALNVVDTPNACAMLFRAFFEMAIFNYMKRHDIDNRNNDRDLTTNQCLAAVRNHLGDKLTGSVLQPINIALSNNFHFMSVQTMHAYVHEPFVFPDQRLLNETWQGFQPFIALILE